MFNHDHVKFTQSRNKTPMIKKMEDLKSSWVLTKDWAANLPSWDIYINHRTFCSFNSEIQI